MERLGIEFKDENLQKADLDLLDAYIEHKRWFKSRSKALYRDWERDKKELKDKTVKMIEEEVEETKEKLLKGLEQYRMESKKEKKHAKLDEKRKGYEEKMRIIQEIEEDKNQHEAEEKRQKERQAK